MAPAPRCCCWTPGRSLRYRCERGRRWRVRPGRPRAFRRAALGRNGGAWRGGRHNTHTHCRRVDWHCWDRGGGCCSSVEGEMQQRLMRRTWFAHIFFEYIGALTIVRPASWKACARTTRALPCCHSVRRRATSEHMSRRGPHLSAAPVQRTVALHSPLHAAASRAELESARVELPPPRRCSCKLVRRAHAPHARRGRRCMRRRHTAQRVVPPRTAPRFCCRCVLRLRCLSCRDASRC